MEINIQSRNLEINEAVREHITRKLEHVNRHLPGVTKALVEIASEPTRSQQDRIVAQITLDVNGSILRGEQRASSTTAAINAVAEVLDRRIARYKSRVYRSQRARQVTPLGAYQAEEATESGSVPLANAAENDVLTDGVLVRVKRFDMQPMTVEEAAFQMQLLGHRFFMFLNSESSQYNLLYQRDDGDYGLIQPAAGE